MTGSAAHGQRHASLRHAAEHSRPAQRSSTVNGGGGPHSYATTVMSRAAWRSRQKRLTVPAVEHARDGDPYRVVDDAVLLREAMRRLAPRQRAVLALRLLCDLSERDAAAVLDCSVGTVKSQSAKAIRRLYDLLPDHSNSHRDSGNSAR